MFICKYSNLKTLARLVSKAYAVTTKLTNKAFMPFITSAVYR